MAMVRAQWNRNRGKQAYKLALLGATDKEIAEFMEINEHTLSYWKRTKPGFLKQLNKGKLEADSRVAKALFRRAIGYSHPDVHIAIYKGEVIKTPIIKHFAPDVTAAIKWLGIRQRAKWQDIRMTEISETRTNVLKIDLTGMSTEELMVLKKVGLKQLAQNASQN